MTTNYDKSTSYVLYKDVSSVKNKKVAILYVFTLLISLLLFITNKDKLILNNKTYYTKTLNKILKDYNDIIVEVSSEANFKKLEILDIKKFEDMVDIEEELKSPILLYEIEKNKKSLFVVVHNNYAYRYILDSKKM
jgi:hypothetical protein